MTSPAPPSRAAIVQGDRSVLLEVDHPAYEDARQILARYAEIEKSPEHVHTYRLSDLALWNAAAAGATADDVVTGLRAISRFDVPSHVEHEIRDRIARHGVCSLHDHPLDPSLLRLSVREPFVRDRLVGPLSRLWPATAIQAAMVAGLVGDPLGALGLEAAPANDS